MAGVLKQKVKVLYVEHTRILWLLERVIPWKIHALSSLRGREMGRFATQTVMMRLFKKNDVASCQGSCPCTADMHAGKSQRHMKEYACAEDKS
jgi:hypothetical protein